MSTPFIPPFPKPHRSKLTLLPRFIAGLGSWIDTLYERSYRMKMGEVNLPGLHYYIANDLPLAEEILSKPLDYPKHDYLHEGLYPLIGDSVFTINGDAWKHARAMVNPAFAHTHLTKAFPNMMAAADAMIAAIDQRDLTQPVVIDPLMTFVTADVIFRTILSHSLSEAEAQQVFDAFERYQRWAQPAMLLRSYGVPHRLFRRPLRRAAQLIHNVLDPVVRARYDAFHRGEDGPDDILHALMKARHPVSGEPFTYEQLRDQVAIIFLAGHETSASALTWALYLIGKCPDLQHELRAEALAEPLSADRLRRMEAIRDTFKETLRLYPPVSFLMRDVAAPTTMRGKSMHPGDLLVVAPWLLQRKESLFPCPHAFQPERWQDASQADACKRAWIPFGAGPRICIGAGFAQQEAAVILARMLARYTIAVPETTQPQPTSRVTLRPKHGIALQLTLRPQETPASPTIAK